MSEEKQKNEVQPGISRKLGLSPLIIEDDVPQDEPKDLVPISEVAPLSKEDQEAEEDFAYARKTTKDIIEKGARALDDLLRVASASENPRAYEVAGQLVKNLGDLSARLLELHDTRRQLVPPLPEPEAPKEVQQGQTGAFVGTTAELLDLIAQERKKRLQAAKDDETNGQTSNQETPKD